MVVVALRNIDEKKPPGLSAAACEEGRGGCVGGWLLGAVFAVSAVLVAAAVLAVAVEEGRG